MFLQIVFCANLAGPVLGHLNIHIKFAVMVHFDEDGYFIFVFNCGVCKKMTSLIILDFAELISFNLTFYFHFFQCSFVIMVIYWVLIVSFECSCGWYASLLLFIFALYQRSEFICNLVSSSPPKETRTLTSCTTFTWPPPASRTSWTRLKRSAVMTP